MTDHQPERDAFFSPGRFFADLVESLPEAIFVLDARMQVVYVNQRAMDLTGYTRDDLAAGINALDLIVEADRPRALERQAATGQGQETGAEEYRIHTKDGQELLVLLQATPIWKDGTVVGWKGILIDLNPLLKTEEALRRSEEKYRRLFQENMYGIFYQQADGRLIDVNPKALELFGLTREEFLSRTSIDPRWKVFREDGAELPGEEHPSMVALRTGRPVRNFIARLQTPERAEDTWISITAIPQFEQGEDHPCRPFVTLPDITDQRKTEEALRHSEARYRNLFEHMINGFALHEIVCDASGKPVDYVFVEANPAFEQCTGLRRADIIGRRVTEVLPGIVDDPVDWIGRYGEVALTGRPIRFEQHSPILSRWYDISAWSMEKGTFATLFNDITDRVKVEEQLRHAQKMESIGRLAGGVAHDFNNLLTIINNYADFTLEDLPDQSPLKHNLQQILDAGTRAADLTRQLLAFSRRHQTAPRMLNLNHSIENLKKMIGRLIGEHIRIETVLEEPLAEVLADPGWIEQPLLNLVINARDAMPMGGTLTISTANVPVSENEPTDEPGTTHPRMARVRLIVTDTGEGIPPHIIDRIFEPFFTTRAPGQGSGLGLATVHGIITQCGGDIRAESRPGSGTSFIIHLPVSSIIPEPPTSDRTVSEARGTESILLVEDEEPVRELCRSILTRAGYRVFASTDAADALAICQRHDTHLQLLLTDIIMPGINGLELSRQLAARCSKLKVLFMSGYPDDVIGGKEIFDAGLRFIAKPFNAASLLKAVRSALDDR